MTKFAAAALALSLSAGTAFAQTYAAPGATFDTTPATVAANPALASITAARSDVSTTGSIGRSGHAPARAR